MPLIRYEFAVAGDGNSQLANLLGLGTEGLGLVQLFAFKGIKSKFVVGSRDKISFPTSQTIAV